MFEKKQGLDIKSSVSPSGQAPFITKEKKDLAKHRLEQFMKEELRMVKGIFQFFECPGMGAKITVKKYKDHFFEKEMMDGKEYEIPLYVARFLNGMDVTAEAIGGNLGTCSYPVSSYLMDAAGNPIITHQKRKRRFGFQSLDYAVAAGQ